jgi:hypothetical protein
MAVLVYSSLFFITNVMTTLYKKYYVYAALFALLALTSIIYHSHPNPYMCILDKLAILGVVTYGGYMLYQKHRGFASSVTPVAATTDAESDLIATPATPTHPILYEWAIVCTFVACIVLYYYGYCYGCFCYHPEKDMADRYHGWMHAISSIGHHMIVFL